MLNDRPRTHMRSASRLRLVIDLVAGMAMIATAVVVMWAKITQPPPSPPPPPPTTTTPPTPVSEVVPSEPQPLAGAAAKGSEKARAGIIEYADFCAYRLGTRLDRSC
jgi:hypothetical protein